MTSDNSAIITFDADLSGLTDALEAASAGVAVFGDRTDAAFGNLIESMQQASALAPGLAQNLASLKMPSGDSDDAKFGQMIDRLSRQAQGSAAKLNEAVVQSDAHAAEDRIDLERTVIAQKQKLGETSNEDAIQQLEDLAAQERDVALARAQQSTQAAQDSGDDAGVVKGLDQQRQAVAKYNAQIVRLNGEAAEDTQKQWEAMFAPVDKAFDSLIDGFVRGTQTWHQAMAKTAQSVEAELIDSAEHTVTHWLATEAAKTTATQAGAEARQAADGAGQDQSLVNHIENAIKHIATDAETVYSNVFAFLSPELGPFAAVPAIAAAGSVVAAKLALPSAAGGWIVPSDQLAMVHENERVLPARYSAGLDAMVGNAAAGQGQGQGGGHTFNNNFHINAADGVTARQLPAMIQSHLERSVRNGTFGSMSRS